MDATPTARLETPTTLQAAIEFFAASPDRSHIRLRYRRTGAEWRRERVGA